MNRSAIAYPLARGIDGDSGGAADLQTDIMRFMAILSLCLVAIFALVQSIPLTPETRAAGDIEAQTPVMVVKKQVPAPKQAVPEPREATPAVSEARVTLTRPVPIKRPVPVARQVPPELAAASDKQQVFTLRFESDLALTRLVAANEVGFFAIAGERARRMAVANSRISFWDASSPGSFHEMEASTVPQPVIDALVRAGVDAGSVKWGVTLPGRLSTQLATLMREHSGGALVIGGNGSLALDASQ